VAEEGVRRAVVVGALAVALGSVAGFLLLAGAPALLSPALRTVYWVDAALLPLLLAALALHLTTR
jgi:hypothetical protein